MQEVIIFLLRYIKKMRGLNNPATTFLRVRPTEASRIKVTVIGYKTSGKTSLLRNIMGWKYNDEYIPTIGDIYQYSDVVHGCSVCFELRDMAGEYVFSALEREMVENSCVTLIVFSLNDSKSFRRAFQMYDRIKDTKRSPIVFVGNKSDLIRKCPKSEEIEKFIENELHESYVEISAKQDNASKLLKRIYEEYEIAKGPYRTTIVPVKSEKKQGKYHKLQIC